MACGLVVCLILSVHDIMIRKSLRLDFIELHILRHASKGPLYGLWMIEELAEHGYWLSASQLYPRFHRLQRKGYLKRSEQVVDGKLRKYYRITREGRAYFREQKGRLVELISETLNTRELAKASRARQQREEARRRSA